MWLNILKNKYTITIDIYHIQATMCKSISQMIKDAQKLIILIIIYANSFFPKVRREIIL